MYIGVLFGCFAGKIAIPGLPGGSIIYQGSPSISAKRIPMMLYVRSSWVCDLGVVA